jgi:hypothetical protein
MTKTFPVHDSGGETLYFHVLEEKIRLNKNSFHHELSKHKPNRFFGSYEFTICQVNVEDFLGIGVLARLFQNI